MLSRRSLGLYVMLLATVAGERSFAAAELPESPVAAWTALQEKESDEARAIVGRRLSGEERAHWRDKLLASRLAAADLAAEFRRRFPSDTNAVAAAKLEAHWLILAGDVAMAQDSTVVERLRRMARAIVQDADLSERSRSELAAALLNRAVYARHSSLQKIEDFPAFRMRNSRTPGF